MRFGTPRYPVDRYLVESSNKIEMVNIEDDLWSPEPALRLEDELLLRRLHDMLRATADDLRLLSAELAHHKAPGLHLKTQPTPLDEDFNEKVYIEDLVTAKFNNKKIVEKPTIDTNTTFTINRHPDKLVAKPKLNVNTGVQVDTEPIVKKTAKLKNLGITRTRILEIDGKIDKDAKNRLNNSKVINAPPAVAYNEFTYKYVEPKAKENPQNHLKIQFMPSINIRSELREQKVLQLDIFPENEQTAENTESKDNVAVIAVQHEVPVPKEDPKITLRSRGLSKQLPTVNWPPTIKTSDLVKTQPIRKVSKMSTCESSGSNNNVSSDTQHNIKTQNKIKSVIRSSPKPSARDRKVKKPNVAKKEPEKRTYLNLDEWKKKINVIYGQPSASKNNKLTKQPKKSPKQSNILSVSKPMRNLLNNAEYIPYSQLTLGGARVSDIEREISDIPNKNDIPLSPILDKILSSRENSFQKESQRQSKNIESPRIFTTSDENLLQEVINIEKKVSKTLTKNIKNKVTKHEEPSIVSSESKENEKDSYADDFEDDKSDITQPSEMKEDSNISQSKHNSDKSENNSSSDSNYNDGHHAEEQANIHNMTYEKKSNLSIKNSVDVFEFVHSVDTQDTATQSNTTHKISLKETQTSPRNDKPCSEPNIQPIHNDLWPVDPRGEVEKMLKLEKDFIKKLILEEYGDILEKNITKPSTSKEDEEEKHTNVVASQKITQTSPARVKSVMTSPARTKTRTTSPFLTVKVDHQTSPMVVVTNEENLTLEIDNDDDDGISINLSSPRFSLRLPQTSREVLSNLEASLTSNKTEVRSRKNNNIAKPKTHRKSTITSSSSEVENSSEISSLGEVKWKLKRRYKKRVSSISESNESSCLSECSSDLPSGGIIPLRSEGEVSFSAKTMMRKKSNKTSKSEGEASLGQLK